MFAVSGLDDWEFGDTLDNSRDRGWTPWGNTVFSHIAFKIKKSTKGMLHAISEKSFVPYLRPEQQDVMQTPPQDVLEDHPIVCRSFAAFPPISSMRFGLFVSLGFSYYGTDTNERGVTVWDVQSTMHDL